ncbi:hypothetical protein BDV96DRAFT_349968 [Lophiotrema nucula]|uniref:Glycoside hydrolase superfamily n=1 Tax=Lophiotrema nucula TaxID=690887 RepID=A0A6A5ZL80_9PLEO|nr:hypothetical protein BDV96DRAFT_349968 [Lophiotrema nucula]
MPSQLLLFYVSSLSAAIMIPAILLQFLFALWAEVVEVEGQFNTPPGVDIWCGKAYRATNSSFDPGGRLTQPKDIGGVPKGHMYLDLRIYPQKSAYLPSDKTATFIVDSILNTRYGNPWENFTVNGTGRIPFTDLVVRLIKKDDGGQQVDVANITVPVNSTGNLVTVGLDAFPPRNQSYSITGLGGDEAFLQSYWTYPQLTVLPERNDTGSVARIDQIGGGIEVKSPITNDAWKPIFPYSFYTSWDWIQSTIGNDSATKNLTTFRELGYNLIHPVPPGGDDPFNHTIFEEFLTICDQLELYVMYDMRHTYQNDTSIADQLSRIKNHPSLLLYYTADEPDGWGDPTTATRKAYLTIKKTDPYHPVSLVLNCENFHFRDYTEGATDIILEDTYPVAANTSYSTVYSTVCNSTYGDCGCDNCHALDAAYPQYVANRFLDIPTRVEQFYTYQEWLFSGSKQPVWGVPQAFYDQGSFWERYPTPEEEIVQALLRINHGAKGIVAWIYPTTDVLEEVTGAFARQVIANPTITEYWLGNTTRVNLKASGVDPAFVDAAAWIKGDEALVSIVSVRDEELKGPIQLRNGDFVFRAVEVETIWGDETTWWKGTNSVLMSNKLDQLSTWVGKVRMK